MSWLPIAFTVPQYEDANGVPHSGAVLKAFAAGTSTNITMATDSTGATQVTSIALNANGFPEVSANIVIPHIEQSFKLNLFPTQAAADLNTGEIWTIDNLVPISNIGFGNAVNSQTATYNQVDTDKGKLILFTGAGGVTFNLLAAATAAEGFSGIVENATSGTVTIDPAAAELINGTSTLVIQAGDSVIYVNDTGLSWRALVFYSATSTQQFTFASPIIQTPIINSATGIGQRFIVRKSADESVTSSVKLKNDGHLIFAIGASETWIARYEIFVTTSLQLTGVKFAWSVPTGATGHWMAKIVASPDKTSVSSTDISGGGPITTGGQFGTTNLTGATSGWLTLDIRVINSTTAGNITLQWAQETSNANALKFRTDSYLIATKES